MQLGIGLLVLQQLSGVNAILFYASSIFKAAGKLCICFRLEILDNLPIIGTLGPRGNVSDWKFFPICRNNIVGYKYQNYEIGGLIFPNTLFSRKLINESPHML